jgi:TP53 regulating kinase-like protein
MSSSSSENKEDGFNPAPREDWTLIGQGAEARIWKLTGNNGSVHWICKERFSKAYRHPDLDARLTKSRCRSEARVLEKCTNKSEIRVPHVVRVEAPLLYLEYMEGPTVKAHLNSPPSENGDVKNIGFEKMAHSMGTVIGRLHNLGVIHGDLTTSNIMLLNGTDDAPKEYELVLIDFGLSKSTTSVEEQAVDLYVMERALLSTHPDLPENFFDKLLEAYSSTAIQASGKKNSQTTLQRLEQVRLRGRKRECFG